MQIQKFDEMNASPEQVRAHYQAYADWLALQPDDVMQARREEAEMIFRRVGITFAVYGAKDEDGSGTERLIPFDLIPRIIPADEWQSMEAGLVQREECPQDGRGTYAVLTPSGWDTIVAAAPDHVASVRQHLVDRLTPEEFEAFGQACIKVAAALRET